MSKTSTQVDLHGLTLKFQTSVAELRQRFEDTYGHLPHSSRPEADITINWTLSQSPKAPAPPPDAPAITTGHLVSYHGTENKLYVHMPKYALHTVDFKRNHIASAVTNNCLTVSGAFEDVILIPLAPLYRRRGWYPLHAFAALSPNGQAALITGDMGAGKTTTGLALLSAGWKLLSNDSPLLTMQGGKVQVLAYPGQLSAFDDSLARFEPLQRFVDNKRGEAQAEDRTKRVFRAEEAFDDPWAEQGPAGGVFFPQVVPGLAHSELAPVPPTEAVLQLMPQAIEGWDKTAIGQNLQLLGKLVEQVPCYGLKLSPHVEQLPALIESGLRG